MNFPYPVYVLKHKQVCEGVSGWEIPAFLDDDDVGLASRPLQRSVLHVQFHTIC